MVQRWIPKNVQIILKNDHKWSFFSIIYTFFVWIKYSCLTILYMVYAMDPNNSVIKRLWCTSKVKDSLYKVESKIWKKIMN